MRKQFLTPLLGMAFAGLLYPGPHAFAQEVKAVEAAQDAQAEATNPFAGDQTAIMLGKVTFEAQCATECHPKADAWKGGKYPDLFDCEWLHGGEDAGMFKTVTEGVPKTEMLGWKGKLSDDVIWKVITYLKSASQCQEGAVRPSLHSSHSFWTILAETAH